MLSISAIFVFFFFNDTATTEIYTLSLHDALPIWRRRKHGIFRTHNAQMKISGPIFTPGDTKPPGQQGIDRKSTRLNSSHGYISYAVFCLKKKKKTTTPQHHRVPSADPHTTRTNAN